MKVISLALRALAALLFAFGAVAASAQEKTATKDGFALEPGTARIILMRPSVRVGEQSTGGLFEPNADWTSQARQFIEGELTKLQHDIGNEVVPYQAGVGGEDPVVAQYGNLFSSVADSVIEYQFFPGNRLPTKKQAKNFEWSMGPGLAELRSLSGADYLLFITTHDEYGSTGRKLLQVAAALGGVAVTSGVHTGYAGLVDLRTGELLWLNADKAMGGDVRTPEGAAKRVSQLLEGFRAGQRKTDMRFAVSTATVAGLLAISSPVRAADAELPTYAQAYEPQTVDERGMWMEADEQERRLKESPLLIKDEELQAYLRRVLCETVGGDRCSAVRIYILEVPGFNATMAPNGVLTVWTGLLLRVRSEAELGAVLGHEFAHFELRHSLRGFQNKRTSSDVAAWAAVLGGLANTNTQYLQTSLVGSMYRYERNQEEQADLMGLKYLAASDYPSSAASGVWTNLMAEADATAAGRKLKARHQYTAGFFDTHPTDIRRASYLAEAAAEFADPDDLHAEGHARAMSGIMPRLLAAQVRLNDFGGSEYLLNELAEVQGWTPDLLYARGEMYQLRGNPRDLVTASQFYQEAINKGLNTPTVHRDLGLALLKSGSTVQARPALEHYLELLPEAPDAPVIRTLIADQ